MVVDSVSVTASIDSGSRSWRMLNEQQHFQEYSSPGQQDSQRGVEGKRSYNALRASWDRDKQSISNRYQWYSQCSEVEQLNSVLFPAPTSLSFFFVLLPSLPSNCRLKAFADTLCWCIVEMVIGYQYIELRGSSCFVYDDSRKCDGKFALVVMWLVVSVT